MIQATEVLHIVRTLRFKDTVRFDIIPFGVVYI